jgi:gamma-glutamyltranspeptidase/glutathione hydrolase
VKIVRRNRLAAAALVALLLASAAPRTAHAVGANPARARDGMVSSAHPLATAVGVEVLRRGGNAVDAAVAVAFALAVVLPWAGNVGGGGFMLVRLADGRTTAIDYREMAPAAAHHDVYLDEKGELIPDASLLGYRAAGVPGTPAGLDLALRKYGTIRWAEAIEPARRLAKEGFAIDGEEASRLSEAADLLTKFDDSRKIFLGGGKGPIPEGGLLVQPDLAATLERMQRGGVREFYEGETARRTAADMKKHGGLITLEDLKGYVAKEREPLRTTYRGREVITMPPPSSGGIALVQMLGMLERYDLAASGFNSSQTIHLEVEAMRRAFADRAVYLGDADFVDVPVAGLLAADYIAKRAATIDERRASTSADVREGDPAPTESSETTHFAVVDRAGNVVSNTYTLNGLYGSKVVAEGTGILLNNEMDDFAAKPGVPNMFGLVQGERNAVGPRKRPLSSMTPTIVVENGEVRLAVGAAGGPTIITAVLEAIVNTIDFGMNLQEAIDAPRIHHQWLPDRIAYEPYGMAADVRDALVARGHRLADAPGSIARAHAVGTEPKTGMRLGAADSRSTGSAAGYTAARRAR